MESDLSEKYLPIVLERQMVIKARLKIYGQENNFYLIYHLIDFVQGKNQTQVLSSEYCEIIKNSFFYTTSPVATFALAIWFAFIFSTEVGVKRFDFF